MAVAALMGCTNWVALLPEAVPSMRRLERRSETRLPARDGQQIVIKRVERRPQIRLPARDGQQMVVIRSDTRLELKVDGWGVVRATPHDLALGATTFRLRGRRASYEAIRRVLVDTGPSWTGGLVAAVIVICALPVVVGLVIYASLPDCAETRSVFCR